MSKYRRMVLRSTTDKATGITKVKASSPSPDRYDDVVKADWNLEHFRSNPVVLFGHDYSRPPVGKVIDIELDGSDLVASIKWDDDPTHNPLGATVAHQFREGFLNAVSVGFTPTEAVERSKLDEDDPHYGTKGMAYSGSELMEISAVPIPAHRGALAMRGAPAIGKHILNVEETDDAWVISYAKGEAEEAEEAESEDEPTDEFDDEAATKGPEDEDEDDQDAEDADDDDAEADDEYDDDDEEEEDEEDEDEAMQARQMRHLVRTALMDLIGSDPTILETNNPQPNCTTADSLAAILGIDK